MSEATCMAVDCERPTVARGCCDRHYRRLRKYGSVDALVRRPVPLCAVDGCGSRATSEAFEGMCVPHAIERRQLERVTVPRPTCSANACDAPTTKRGMCERHYRRALEARPQPPCAAVGCGESSYRTNLCQRHYGIKKRANRAYVPCSVEDCTDATKAAGLCGKHYQRLRNTGTTDGPDEPAPDTTPRTAYTDPRPLPTVVLLRCAGCRKAYTKPRHFVLKAQARHAVHPFCSRTCSDRHQGEHIRQRQATLVPVLVESLPIEATVRTGTGRRRYYDDSLEHTGFCAVCGKDIRKGRGKTCRDCYMAARASTYMTVPCTACGAEFRLMRAEHEKKLRKGQVNRYCSSTCLADVLRTGTPCKACGKTMHKAQGRQFCSEECRRPARTTTRKRNGHRVLEPRVCPTCETQFRPHSSRTVYCSRPCAESGHSARMVGEGNSHYKDGTSYAEWFKRMRPLIIERDGCCRVCAEIKPDIYVSRRDRAEPVRRSQMVIHHIDANPQRNHPENLIYLCQSCHMSHHKARNSPYGWFADYATQASAGMPAQWLETTAALATKFNPTSATTDKLEEPA